MVQQKIFDPTPVDPITEEPPTDPTPPSFEAVEVEEGIYEMRPVTA